MELVVNHSRRFYKFLRSIDTRCSVFGGLLTQKKEKMENCGLSCQSFSEILRISEKVWYETHQYLNWLSKIEGISLKLKKQKAVPFQAQINPFKPKKTVKISGDSPFQWLVTQGYDRPSNYLLQLDTFSDDNTLFFFIIS